MVGNIKKNKETLHLAMLKKNIAIIIGLILDFGQKICAKNLVMNESL